MDINKHIVDQRIAKIVEENPDWFSETTDFIKKKSKSFLLLSVSTYLGIELAEAYNYLTEGGNDAGIDAIFIGDIFGDEFPVYIFQGKYKFDLDVDSNFPANSIQKVSDTIKTIFDPKKIVTKNKDLTAKIAEIGSLISDAKIPIIKCVFTNNGLKWNDEGENHIKNADFSMDQVLFEHYNHVDIVHKITNNKPVKATIRMSGVSISEDYNYKRVIIGKLNVLEIKSIFDTHSDNLLQKNVRRYLGLHNKNNVNSAIKATLKSERRENFYFYNNGITMICSKYNYAGLQKSDWIVNVEDLQIINGGQTCKTIQDTLKENPSIDYSNVYVLVRLYELSGDNTQDLITDITLATNSQNPVDLRDLRANDYIQRAMEEDVKNLGFTYKRIRDAVSSGDFIPSSVAAEAIYSIWHEKPQITKFSRNNLFGKYYDQIFKDINAAQLVIAVLIFRLCDNFRRKEILIEEFPHLPYSNLFLSMIIGKILLKDNNLVFNKLNHNNFPQIQKYFEDNKELLFKKSNLVLIKALNKYFPEDYKSIELRRLSATFRRGDLLDLISIE